MTHRTTSVEATDRDRPEPVSILLVEDNPADAELALISLRRARVANEVNVVEDGEQAMSYLRREGEYGEATRPDLILLDLNLPGMDGREVLHEVKADESLRSIPVVVLTTSDARSDIEQAYGRYANSYMTKPVDFKQFHEMVTEMADYWFTLVKLP